MNQYSVKGQTDVSAFNFIVVFAQTEREAWEKSVSIARSKYRNWVVVGVEKL